MKPFGTVIFDLDGTLLNTLEDLKDAVNAALSMHQFPKRTLEEVQSFVGNGVRQLILKAVPENTKAEEAEACLTDFKAYYNLHSQDKTKPYEGILKLLETLKENQINIAVVSNKYEQAVKELCKHYFGACIMAAVGDMDDVPKKPAPDSVCRALRELEASVEDAVYVGDSEVDVETAKNAGMSCIGVSWGFRGRRFLEEAGADCIIDAPEELLDFVRLSR